MMWGGILEGLKFQARVFSRVVLCRVRITASYSCPVSGAVVGRQSPARPGSRVTAASSTSSYPSSSLPNKRRPLVAHCHRSRAPTRPEQTRPLLVSSMSIVVSVSVYVPNAISLSFVRHRRETIPAHNKLWMSNRSPPYPAHKA